MIDYVSTVEGFPERLADLIYCRYGISAEKLAYVIRVNRHTVASYLHGESTPNMVILARICSFFHVSADYLLFGKE